MVSREVAETCSVPLQGKPERRHLYEWVEGEEEYVEEKFGDQRGAHDAGLVAHDLNRFWLPQVMQYLDRAGVFLNAAHECHSGSSEQRAFELRAQQALAKGMMTFKGLVESSIRVYGGLPEPGVPSGEIRVEEHSSD